MSGKPISPLQVAFLLVAATLAGAVVARAATAPLALTREDAVFISRLVTLTLEGAMVLGIGELRRSASRALAPPFPASRLAEVAAIGCIVLLAQFGRFGLMALERWWHGGDVAVAAMALDPARGASTAYSAPVLRSLAVTGLVAPVIEELLFRGFLFERWRRRHSTATAMLLASVAFGLCHDGFAYAFAVGLLLNALYVRTGSLRAAIVVHAIANLAFWYPLLGQLLMPRANDGIGRWWPQLSCAVLFVVLAASYAALASRHPAPSPAASPGTVP